MIGWLRTLAARHFAEKAWRETSIARFRTVLGCTERDARAAFAECRKVSATTPHAPPEIVRAATACMIEAGDEWRELLAKRIVFRASVGMSL